MRSATNDDRAFLGHPKGLGFLGFTEACERFSYYSMQTLLVLYMVNYLLAARAGWSTSSGSSGCRRDIIRGFAASRSPRRSSALYVAGLSDADLRRDHRRQMLGRKDADHRRRC